MTQWPKEDRDQNAKQIINKQIDNIGSYKYTEFNTIHIWKKTRITCILYPTSSKSSTIFPEEGDVAYRFGTDNFLLLKSFEFF